VCGRTRLDVPPSELAEAFDVGPAGAAAVDPEQVRNLNCAPTDPVLVVRRARDSDARELVVMRWGLVPFWAHDFHDQKPLINARVETVSTSRAFRDSFHKRRCLVLADGFYEWRHEGKKKLPHVVRRPDGAPFGMAGIWDRWKGPRGERIETCAVITRDPSDAVAAVHDRMPLALHRADHAAWLDPTTDDAALHAILDRAVMDWVVTPVDRMPDPPGKKQLRLFS
jgi:putative SOS response-associated peptidase YedK